MMELLLQFLKVIKIVSFLGVDPSKKNQLK